MDLTRRLARIEPQDTADIGADPGLADTAAILLAAEQIGAAAKCLDLTVEYTKDRVQFGRPIGSFQALKHRMADLYVAVQSARAVVNDAIAEPSPTSAALARVAASEAFSKVAARSGPDARRHRDHLGARHPAVLQAGARQRAAARAAAGASASARIRGVLAVPVRRLRQLVSSNGERALGCSMSRRFTVERSRPPSHRDHLLSFGAESCSAPEHGADHGTNPPPRRAVTISPRPWFQSSGLVVARSPSRSRRASPGRVDSPSGVRLLKVRVSEHPTRLCGLHRPPIDIGWYSAQKESVPPGCRR